MGLINILTSMDHLTQYLAEAQGQGKASERNQAKELGESHYGVKIG